MKSRREIMFSILFIWLPTVYYMHKEGLVLSKEIGFRFFLIPSLITVFSIVCIFAAHELERMKTIPSIINKLVCSSIPLFFSLGQFKKIFDLDNIYGGLLNKGNILVGILIIIIGNNFPKIQFSKFVGLKFWWLKNRMDVWKKSHLLAGYLWILTGIIMIMAKDSEKAVFITIYVFLLYLIPLIYAIILYLFTEDKSKR